MTSSSSIRRVQLINHREKAIKGLFEGHNAITELHSLVQRGNWADESSKSLATSMCQEVGQIFQEGIARLDFDIINVENVEIVTASPHADGFQWNKYGRRMTTGGGHNRAHYRCVHNGCLARKIVEQHKDDENSSMFKVTYLKHHTCNKANTPHDGSGIIPPVVTNECNFNDIEQNHQHSDIQTQDASMQQDDGCGFHRSSSVGPTRSDQMSEERANDRVTVNNDEDYIE